MLLLGIGPILPNQPTKPLSLCKPTQCGMHQVFLTPTHLALVMEYAPGGDLYQHLITRTPFPWFPENQARWLFQQMLIGLDYCHKQVCARSCQWGRS